MGPEPPIQKSSKPVVTTAGTGFFRHLWTSGVLGSDLFVVAVRCSTSECEDDRRGFHHAAQGSREEVVGRSDDEFRDCAGPGEDCGTGDSRQEGTLGCPVGVTPISLLSRNKLSHSFLEMVHLSFEGSPGRRVFGYLHRPLNRFDMLAYSSAGPSLPPVPPARLMQPNMGDGIENGGRYDNCGSQDKHNGECQGHFHS